MSANLERQQVGEQFKVLDPARLPEKPFSPNRVRLALIAAALGLFLAIGLIGLLEYRDMTLRTRRRNRPHADPAGASPPFRS